MLRRLTALLTALFCCVFITLLDPTIAQAQFSAPPGLQVQFGPDGKPSVNPAAPQVPGQPKPGQVKPPGQAKPGQARAGQTRPGQTRPGQTKPGQPGAPGKKPQGNTIKRPEKPPTPPNPKEFEVKPDDDGMVQFQFRGQSWPDVLDWLADVSGVSLDWLELPKDYVNLTTRRPYSLEEARDMINQRLLSRGYTMLSVPGGFMVVNITKLNPALVPRKTPLQMEKCQPHDFVKVSFTLRWLVADDVIKEMESMKSPMGKLTALSSTNRIEAVDAVINLKEMFRFLEEEQSPENRSRLAREFPLKYTRATEIAEELKNFLGVGGGGGGAPRGMNPQQMAMMQQQAMMAAQMARQRGGKPPTAVRGGGASSSSLKVVANRRRNSIVVHAPPDKLAIAAEFILLVDVRSDISMTADALDQRMHVFRLAALDPAKLVASLEELGGLEPMTRLTVDEKNRALIVYGSPSDRILIKSIIDRLDGSGRKFEVIPLRRLDAEAVAGSVSFLMGASDNKEKRRSFDPWDWSRRSRDNNNADKFRVSANLASNQLMLWANTIEMQEVHNLLEKLGEIPKRGVSDSRVRIMNAGTGEDLRKFLKVLKGAWGDVGENELILPDDSSIPDNPRSKPPERTEPPPLIQTQEATTTTEKKPTAADFRFARLVRPGQTPNEDSAGAPGKAAAPKQAVGEAAPAKAIAKAPAPPKEGAAPAKAKASPPPKEGAAPAKSKAAAPPKEGAAPPIAEQRTGPPKAKLAGDPPVAPQPESPFDIEKLRQRLEELKRQRRNPAAAAPLNPEPPPAATAPATSIPAKSAPIRISINANGELVIACRDPAALNMLEELMEQLQPPRKEFEVFHLKYASALFVKWNLEDYFEEEEEKGNGNNEMMGMMMFGIPPSSGGKSPGARRLGQRKPPRFIDDYDTNTILVQNADPATLKIVGRLIALYDVPEPTLAQNARITKMFHIKYSKATLVTQTIKEAYRDLLSSNDRSLQQQQQPQRRGNDNNRNNGNYQQPPQKAQMSFKGKLAIGADDVTNVMIVSCEGEALMGIITKMIEALDVAAKPAAAVDVVQLDGHMNTDSLRKALQVITGKREGTPSRQNRPSPPPQPPVQPQPPRQESPAIAPFGIPGG